MRIVATILGAYYMIMSYDKRCVINWIMRKFRAVWPRIKHYQVVNALFLTWFALLVVAATVYFRLKPFEIVWQNFELYDEYANQFSYTVSAIAGCVLSAHLWFVSRASSTSVISECFLLFALGTLIDQLWGNPLVFDINERIEYSFMAVWAFSRLVSLGHKKHMQK